MSLEALGWRWLVYVGKSQPMCRQILKCMDSMGAKTLGVQ